VCGWVVGES